MDETTQIHFLRMKGQISAMDTMLMTMLKAMPSWRAIARSGAISISATANALTASGDQDLEHIAVGMREYLESLAGQLDT